MTLEKFGRGTPHMNIVRRWWAQHTRLQFNEDLLSDHGWMALDNGRPIAAAFLYPTEGSAVALVGWPISCPSTTKAERNLALNQIFDMIHREARQMGYKLVWSFSGVEPVQERLMELGYTVGDTNINQYFKGL